MKPGTWLPWMAVAMALLAACLPPAARALAGPRGAMVNIRWQPLLTESERQSIESRFRLADGEDIDQYTWRYDLIDPSRDNIRALVRESAVADTHHIDRPNGTLESVANRTARRQRFQAHGDRLVALADRLAITLAVMAALLPLVSRTRRSPAARALWRRLGPTFQAPATGAPSSAEDDRGDHRPWLWTAAVLAAAAPAVITLCLTLWHSPFAISEVVALLEDVEEQPVTYFFDLNRAYYRPLSYLTLSTIWHYGGSLDTRLALIKLLTIAPVLLLVGLFIWHLRPRTALEAAAASVAAAVLIGSAGLRDNLEVGLYDTIVGMSIAMLVWVVLSRERRIWHAPVILACTLVAVGFKEQGLALVPLVIAAWWTRAPGVSRGVAVTLGAFGITYVALRLIWQTAWLPFEQDVGLGFTEIPLEEAAARFGAFPYWVYAYSGASTISNLLFAEPRRGIFRIVQAWGDGQMQPWQFIHLGSSFALTAVMAWWGVRGLKTGARGRWSPESRLFVCTVLVVLAAGALSFNYSRERLAGVAVVFYAIAAFSAVRAAAVRTLTASRAGFVLGALGLALLAAAWHTRALGTIEWARGQSWANHQEWLVALPARRIEYAHRPVYVRIMESMVEQGADPAAPRSTRFPDWMNLVIGAE